MNTSEHTGPGAQLDARMRRHEPRGFTAQGPPLVWERAAGTTVWDTDGRTYVDLTAAFGVATVGHCHPAVVEAVTRQARMLMHAMADVYPSRIKIDCLERLIDWVPANYDAAYLGLSGADAIEAALKVARLVTGRRGVIAFEHAYHGLSLGALEACGLSSFRAAFDDRRDDVHHLPFPHAGAADAALESLRTVLDSRSVGAVIFEPIQGRGGVRSLAPGALEAMRHACDATGTLLVADEIWTGIGRTGKRLCCDSARARPDLIAVGKALGGGVPISALIGARETFGDWDTDLGAIHTSTFSGHPLGAAAAIAVLDVIDGEALVERSRTLGGELRARLVDHFAADPTIEIRGAGLMVGIELSSVDGSPDGDRVRRIQAGLRDRGILVLAGGPTGAVIELTPPLTIDDRVLTRAADILCELIVATPECAP